MEKVLVTTDEFNGKYVALKSAEDNSVVGKGNNPEEALDEAKKKGIQNPFIIYIPDKDLVQIYRC